MKASSGAFIIRQSCGAKMKISTVIVRAMIPKSTMAVPIVSPPSFRLPLPICCPRRIVVPIAKLLIRFVMVAIS